MQFRHVLARFALRGTALTCLILLTAEPIYGQSDNRNVVFILVDDLGWTDLGCYGSTFYETPNIDRLAASGVRFTQAYAACPVCSPTRASIMTGKHPARLDTTDYFGAAQPGEWKRNTPLLPAPYRDRLPHSEVTVAEALHENGYATFFAGKWHLGPESHWPETQGFDINKGGITLGGPYGGKKYFSPYGNPRLTDGPAGEHLPARLGNETAAFIRANKDRPFFAYLSFYSVHTPLMARSDLEAKYAAKANASPVKEPRWGRIGERQWRLVQDHAVYAGMIEAMDAAVGVVLDTLEAEGLSENTLVILTSDNGGLSTSEGHPTSNLPLRAGKGWLYEGGIRVPAIVRWPGVATPGSVRDAPIASADYYPTILEFAGLSPRPKQHLDGQSLLPFIRGKSAAPRALFWHYPHYGNQGGSPGSAIREGDWKLIAFHGSSRSDDRHELYNLLEDPGEGVNRADRNPEMVIRLKAILNEWYTEVGAKFPLPFANNGS